MRWQFGKGGRVVRSQGGCTDGKILLRLKEVWEFDGVWRCGGKCGEMWLGLGLVISD